MKIIIVGTGTVGTAILAGLAEEGHSITVIDKDEEALNEVTGIYDVTGYVGSGADVDALRNIGADRSELVIAVTPSDELNILCCFAAKKMGARHTIARVRNPELVPLTRLTKDDMGLSLLINPEHEAAREIYRVLRLPSATKVDTFCRGRVELTEFTVPEGSPMSGRSLRELRDMIDIKFLVAGIYREGEFFIPTGDTVIASGDRVLITTSVDNTAKFFKAIKSYKSPVKNVLIFGGSRIAYYLAELMRRDKVSLTVIERDREKCRHIAEDFDISVINGDGTRQQLLLEEGIERADAFLALSEVDEENAITSMFAKTKNVPKIVTLIKSLPYVDLFREVGLDSVVSPKSATVEQILRFVRSREHGKDEEILSLHRLMDDALEALEFAVKEAISGLTDIPLCRLRRKENTLIACIIRGEEVIIPTGNDMITQGDKVIIITTEQSMNSIKDILK